MDICACISMHGYLGAVVVPPSDDARTWGPSSQSAPIAHDHQPTRTHCPIPPTNPPTHQKGEAQWPPYPLPPRTPRKPCGCSQRPVLALSLSDPAWLPPTDPHLLPPTSPPPSTPKKSCPRPARGRTVDPRGRVARSSDIHGGSNDQYVGHVRAQGTHKNNFSKEMPLNK